MGQIKVEIKNLRGILKRIESLEGAGEKAITNTVNDIKKRAPGWVAQEVTKTYNIDKKEIIPGSTRKVRGGGSEKVKQAGKLGVYGETLETMTLVYTGRPLTPLHFKMKPKKPPTKRESKAARIPGESIQFKGKPGKVAMIRPLKPYEITQMVFKGKETTINGSGKYEGPPFLAKASGHYLPFQRKANGKLHGIKTISVPQMVDNKEVNDRIYTRLSDETEKRLRHNIKRYMKT